MDENKILFTGGSGLLGSELRKMMPEAIYPTSKEFNVTNYSQMEEYINGKQISILVHAAAFTSPPKIDQDPQKAIDVNIIGTSNIVKICYASQIKLIYISTDYVFEGDKGNYSENDALKPINRYAWSKLGGECAVQMYDNSLIIRTSFGPNEFPFPKAFIDQWTSRESVHEIAKKIVFVLQKSITGVLHIGGKRQTVYEYATCLDKNKKIEELSIKDVPFKVPKDTSLSCEFYDEIMKMKKGE